MAEKLLAPIVQELAAMPENDFLELCRDTERIEADEMRRDVKCLVFITAVVVVDSPRTVVVLRLR